MPPRSAAMATRHKISARDGYLVQGNGAPFPSPAMKKGGLVSLRTHPPLTRNVTESIFSATPAGVTHLTDNPPSPSSESLGHTVSSVFKRLIWRAGGPTAYNSREGPSDELDPESESSSSTAPIMHASSSGAITASNRKDFIVVRQTGQASPPPLNANRCRLSRGKRKKTR